MYKKYLFGLCASSLLATALHAQTPTDALQGSDFHPMGTARGLAVGQALGAIGGDMSSLSVNPAGLGVYRNSELVISPSIQSSDVQTTFAGKISTQSRLSLNLSGAGVIFSVPIQEADQDWRSFNLGIAYQRLNNFNQTFYFNNTTYGSRLVNFVESANGNTPDLLNPYDNQLAYDAYLIDLDGSGSGLTYVGALTDSNYVEKSQLVRRSGGLSEVAISTASSYKHRFFIGATLGIPILRFDETRSYSEVEPTDLIDFKRMTFDETRKLRGTGINLKIGMIGKITQSLRVGLHVHTPTWYKLTDQFSSQLYGEVVYADTLRQNTLTSPEYRYQHNLITPTVLGLSLAYVGQGWFFSAEGEWLNYRASHFALLPSDTAATTADQAYIDDINLDIKAYYTSAFRVRAGLEYALGDVRLRLGYRLQTSPYRLPAPGISDLRHDLSAGLGIRKRKFFLDLAYVRTFQEFEYQPYPASSLNSQSVLAKYPSSTLMLTLGFRFGHRD